MKKRRRFLLGTIVIAMGTLCWVAWLVGSEGSTVAVIQSPLGVEAESRAMLRNPPPELRGVKVESAGIGELWVVTVPGTGEAQRRRLDEAIATMNGMAIGWWDVKAEKHFAATGELISPALPAYVVYERPKPLGGGMLAWWRLEMWWDALRY